MTIKYKLSATVPVAQYANLCPEIEVEADTIEDAEKQVLPYIEDFFNKYAEKDKRIGGEKEVMSSTRQLVKDIFGNEIYYDDATHRYTNTLGEIYLSGSQYAQQTEQPFDGPSISMRIAKKYKLGKIDSEKIQEMWRLKGTASASFGTSIHAALELYGKYKDLAESIEKETHMHDNGALNRAVKTFYDEYPDVSNVAYECLIVDHKMKRAGRVDRLEYQPDGSIYVTDFKTNYDINKSLKKYWLQLSFYAAIIKANGLQVNGLKIYHWDDKKWSTLTSDVIDIGIERG